MNEIICFGVREFEIPYFNKIGSELNYKFILESTFITEEIINLSKGYNIMMVRGNCFLDSNSMIKLKENGVKIILSRSVGYNNLDITTCKDIGIEVFRVPSYSPNAIAELAVSLTLMLLRNTAYTINKTSNKDFTIDNQMFSREIRKCTVGIIGCGEIGYTCVKLFEGLGANVIVYNRSKNKKVNYVDLDYLIKNSDIISLHMPYFKNENHHFINKNLISKMKKDVIIINTARGDLVNTVDLIEALETDMIYGAGLDVLENENDLFFKVHNKFENDLYDRIVKLYPKLLITPHVGASTQEALKNMIEISISNLEEYINTGECKNSLTKK